MRRFIYLSLLLLSATLAFALTGCGGHKSFATRSGSSQRIYTVNGHKGPHAANFGKPPSNSKLRRKVAGVPTLEQFDAIYASYIPGNAPAAAGYTAGYWPDYLAIVSRFPGLNAQHRVVSIAISASYHASCLDVEPGDASPSQAGNWARADIAAGFWKPCIYTSLSQMGAVRYYLGAAGLSRGQYRLWDADWSYHPGLDAGYDCTQWTDRYAGGQDDESTCATTFYQSSGPPPDPYAIFPRSIPGTHINERATVVNWDQQRCQNPVRRHICVVSRKNMIWLRGRLDTLAHGVWTPPHPNYNRNNGGSRRAYLNVRISATHPTHL